MLSKQQKTKKILAEFLTPIEKRPVEDTKKFKKITIKLNFKGLEFFSNDREYRDTRPFYIRKSGELIIGKQNFFNGSVAIISNEFDGTICSNAIMSFEFRDIEPKYLFYNITRNSFLKRNESKANGTGQKELSEKDFLNLEIEVHSGLEQQKIGSFLSAFDRLIEKQKEKVDRIKSLKKGYLQKMFPNEGEDEPKIRFKAYKAQWNNLELVSILDVNSGRDYKHLANGQIPVYGTGGYMLSVSEALSNKDAIGIGRKGTIDNPFILKAPFWTVDTLFYVIPKKNQNLYFLYALFQNTNWKKLDESTGVPSLSKKAIELKRENVPLPDEQEKIGLFFMKIDNLLEKEQTLFETYNQLKKSYLQKIFAD